MTMIAFSGLTSALVASSSFPVAFLPERIGELLTDGGVRDVTPLTAALDLKDVTHIDVIVASMEKPQLSPLVDPNAFDILARVVDLMCSEIVEGDLRDAIPKAVEAGVEVTVMRPNEPLLDDSLKMTSEDAERLINLGLDQAREVFGVDEQDD